MLRILVLLGVIAGFHASAQAGQVSTPPPAHDVAVSELEQGKLDSIKEVISGCSEAVLEPTIRKYMDKANAKGSNLRSTGEARTMLESLPAWKSKVVPGVEAMCRCWYADVVSDLESAQSIKQLLAVLDQFPARAPKVLKNIAANTACFDGMKSGLRGDIAK